MEPEEQWVMIACAVSAFVFGSFYAFVVKTVPEKEEIDFRTRLHLHMLHSKQGNVAEIWVAVFSFGSCLLFVWDTYLDATPLWMFMTELVFSWLFFFQFWFDMYCSKSRCGFFIKKDALVDIVTVTPVLIQAFTSSYAPIYDGDSSSTGFIRFTRVVKITRVFRLMRLLRSVRVLTSPIDDAIQLQITELVSTILSLIVITTGFVQFLAQNFGADWGGCEVTTDNPVCPDLEFHDALYFTIVTMSTVGYGDISPKDGIGRMCMVVMMVFTMVVVPMELEKLANLLSFRSRYGGNLKVSKSLAVVVLGCDPGCSGVGDFLQQFFHEDHAFVHSHLVVLCPAEPDTTWKALMLKYKKRLTYLKGDMMNSKDLARAQAESCLGCFIMADRFCLDTNKQDAATILRALAVYNYDQNIKCYVELIEPENRKYLVSVGLSKNRILCHNELKMGLVAQGCMWMGFTTLISNLLLVSNNTDLTPSNKWQEEYAQGSQQEIYRAPIGRRFGGQSFTAIAKQIWEESGTLLFALFDDRSGVVLHPGDKYLVEDDDFGFIIASHHQAVVDVIGAKAYETNAVSSAKVVPTSSGASGSGGIEEGRRGSAMNSLFGLTHTTAPASSKPKPGEDDSGSTNGPIATLAKRRNSRIESNAEASRGKWTRSLEVAMLEYASNAVDVTGHIVVLCTTLDDLGDMFTMMTCSHLPERAIVVVCPCDTVDDAVARKEMTIDWEEMTLHDHIHLVCGRPDDGDVLRRANVGSAHTIAIFSAKSNENVNSTMLSGTANILTALGVYAEIDPSVRVIVELNDSTCVEHFGCISHSRLTRAGAQMQKDAQLQDMYRDQDAQDVVDLSPTKTSSLAASPLSMLTRIGGAKASTNSPDSKQSKPDFTSASSADAYKAKQGKAGKEWNTADDRIEAMVNEQFVSEHNYLLNSSYINGDVALSNFSELLLCQAFFNPHIVGVTMALLSGGAELAKTASSSSSKDGSTVDEDEDNDPTGRHMAPSTFVQIPIPAAFIAEEKKKNVQAAGASMTFKYRDLMNFLTSSEYDVLPVALFRVGSGSREAVVLREKSGGKSFEQMDVPEHSYVVTNPPPETICSEHDRVFCMVHSERVWKKLRAQEGAIVVADPPAVYVPAIVAGAGAPPTADVKDEVIATLESELSAEKLRADLLRRQVSALRTQVTVMEDMRALSPPPAGNSAEPGP